jgi:hypothetical protein
VDGRSESLEGPPWTTTLAPDLATTDTVALEVTVSWASGALASVQAELAVDTAAMAPTWDGHIEPLSSAEGGLFEDWASSGFP